jgi:hypothetical protein
VRKEARVETILDKGKFFVINKSARQRSFAVLIIFVTAISLSSCIAAVPIAVKWYKDADRTVAKAEMPVPAEKVYSTALTMAEEKDLEILKEERDKFLIEVTDGVQKAVVKAEPLDNEKTKLTVEASVPKVEGEEKVEEKTREKELALRIVDRICTRLYVECKIVKE